MNHPFLEAYRSIDPIFQGRFIRACQSETILLLARAMNEPASEPRIVWGVRGAESTRGSLQKRTKNMYFFEFFARVFSDTPVSSRMKRAKKCGKKVYFADSDMHFVRITVTLHE